jgi:hypothetical protein
VDGRRGPVRLVGLIPRLTARQKKQAWPTGTSTAGFSTIAVKDAAGLAGIPRGKLRSGNSEILNWVTAAAVLEGLTPTILDYVLGYRTPAGTTRAATT